MRNRRERPYVPPAPAFNDCDMEALQQQAIQGSGYSQPSRNMQGDNWKQTKWEATDESGNQVDVPRDAL